MSITLAWDDVKSADAWRAALVELIAVFVFVFVSVGAVVVTGFMTDDEMTPARLIAIAFANGLAIALLVAATARFSGGHINPAVTVSVVVTGKMGITKGVMYVVAQLAGAIVAALALKLVIFGDGALGVHALGDAVDGAGAGLLVEMALTFFLVFVIFAAAMGPKGPSHLAPIAIGLVILVDLLIGVPLTGASMNPARSFGPALVAGEWADHWIYWVGPIVGGSIAALMYEYIFLRGRAEASAE